MTLSYDSTSVLPRDFSVDHIVICVNFDILSTLQVYTFNIIGSILVSPVGGAILGLAFLIVSRKIHDPSVKNYMRLSALGIMLFAISNEDARIYPYQPFGLVTISFMGISSYLMVGIYHSSISISMNSQIRSLIERSVTKDTSGMTKHQSFTNGDDNAIFCKAVDTTCCLYQHS